MCVCQNNYYFYKNTTYLCKSKTILENGPYYEKGNDEVSDIADSINELLEYIRGVVHSIYEDHKQYMTNQVQLMK